VSPGKHVEKPEDKKKKDVPAEHKKKKETPPDNKNKKDIPVEDDDDESLSAPPVIINKTGAPAWIVTFADLSTLMLTFFVLLLSFANMDIVKFQEMLGSVQDAFGVQKKIKGNYQATSSSDAPGEPGASTEGKGGKTEEEQNADVANAISRSVVQSKQSESISISVGAHGVMVRVKGGYFFDPGKAILKEKSIIFLESIAKVLKEIPFKVKVEGHTDNIPISTPVFPSNWELSAIRATTVLRYLIEKQGIQARRLTAIGYGDNKPIAPNDTPEGRGRNRRVEFVFHKK